MVKRYIGSIPNIFLDENGNLVKYEDYEKLEKENERLKTELITLEVINIKAIKQLKEKE